MVTSFFIRLQKLFVVVCFTASVLCFSQSTKDSLQERAIPKVTVYKKKYTEIIPAQTLSGQDLERLNSQSVSDALRYFSGVQIKDYGGVGGLKTINIRSMGSQHVGVFYDGIQLGNAQNGLVDLGRFSLDDMEEISLYNGQKSEIFQPAKDFGSSGSIYLQPKSPSFRANQKTNLTLKLKNASIELFNPSFRLEQKISRNVSASASAEFLQSNGIYRYRYFKKYPDGVVANDTVAKRYDSDIKSKRLETGLYGTLKNGSWNLRGYAYLSDRGIPSAIVNNGFKPQWKRMQDENYFVQANFRKKIFNNLDSQIKTKFAYDYTRYTDTLNIAQTNRWVDNAYLQREFYISSSNLYSIAKNWDISANADFQFNNLDAKGLVNFSFPTRYTSLVAFASTYQWKKLSFLGSILGTFVQEKVKMNAKSPDKNEWTPSAFVNYQLSNDVTLRAFYKRVFRMPTFNDLYYTEIGNSFLKPEFTNQYDVGVVYQKFFEHSVFKNFYIKADAYFNKVNDKIVAMPTTNLFRWTMMNLGSVEVIGADINIQSELQWGQVKIKPLLSYTYQHAKDFTDRSEPYFGNQIPYTPWHAGTFTLMSDYKTWGFNYSFIYVGERYDGQIYNIAYNYVQPWYTHDLSIQKKVSWGKHQFRTSFEVNNLLNQNYDVVINYPMPGRNYRLIVSFNL